VRGHPLDRGLRTSHRPIRLVDVAVGAWTVLWLVAGAYVYVAVKQLEDYGETTVTASVGLQQTSRGLSRAATGLRDTGQALADIPFVGGDLDANVRRTAGDVDVISRTVRRTARQARASGEQTRDAARGIAIVLAAAVATVPTVPLVALYVVLRPLLVEELRRRARA
jgi:hypothetical protein